MTKSEISEKRLFLKLCKLCNSGCGFKYIKYQLYYYVGIEMSVFVELIYYLKQKIVLTILIIVCVSASIVLTNLTSLIAHEAELDFDKYQETYNDGQFYEIRDRLMGDIYQVFEKKYDTTETLVQINNWLHSCDKFEYFEYCYDWFKVVDNVLTWENEENDDNIMYDALMIGEETINHFEFQVSEGRLFYPEEYIHQPDMSNTLQETTMTEYPVIVGNNLKSKYKIGDIIDFVSTFSCGKARVIGYFKPGIALPMGGDIRTIDNYVFMPFYSEFSGNETTAYMTSYYFQKNNGTVYSRYSVDDVQSMINDYMTYLGIPGAYFLCGSNNQWQPIFAQNLEGTVDGIRKLAIGITMFSIIILAVYMCIRILKSARYYGILLINGFNTLQIRLIILGEVFFMLISSLGMGTFVSWLIKDSKYREYDINLLMGLIPFAVIGLSGVAVALIILNKREISVTIKDE